MQLVLCRENEINNGYFDYLKNSATLLWMGVLFCVRDDSNQTSLSMLMDCLLDNTHNTLQWSSFMCKQNSSKISETVCHFSW